MLCVDDPESVMRRRRGICSLASVPAASGRWGGTRCGFVVLIKLLTPRSWFGHGRFAIPSADGRQERTHPSIHRQRRRAGPSGSEAPILARRGFDLSGVEPVPGNRGRRFYLYSAPPPFAVNSFQHPLTPHGVE